MGHGQVMTLGGEYGQNKFYLFLTFEGYSHLIVQCLLHVSILMHDIDTVILLVCPSVCRWRFGIRWKRCNIVFHGPAIPSF